MKRILLSVLYALFIIAGLLGLFFEGVMLSGPGLTAENEYENYGFPDTDKGLYPICEDYQVSMWKPGKLDELKRYLRRKRS